MNHNYVFNYFQQKLKHLRDEYRLNTIENNPCSIRSKDDVRVFVTQIAEKLFEETDYSFTTKGDSRNRTHFVYLGQEMYLDIDEKFGHIELDFYKTIEFMALLSGKMIATVNPTGFYVTGDEDDMRAAWSKGLPIHVPEVDFRHRHMTGKYFKKEETKSSFILEGTTDVAEYEKEILLAYNTFLEDRLYNIRYTSDQIKAYSDHKNYICTQINGDYARGVLIKEGKMVFGNGFENQILLSNYLSNKPHTKIHYALDNGEQRIVEKPFAEFISTLGKEE